MSTYTATAKTFQHRSSKTLEDLHLYTKQLADKNHSSVSLHRLYIKTSEYSNNHSYCVFIRGKTDFFQTINRKSCLGIFLTNRNGV